MNILFFIATLGHGRGGHYHSLNHISKAVSDENNNVKIVSLGPGFSTVLSENVHFEKHIQFNGTNALRLKKEVLCIKNSYKPDVVHFFDSSSYNLLRLYFNPRKVKVLLNKCGGPNPNNYPFANNIIVFSKENFDWFKAQQRYNRSSIFLIPNRVNPVILHAASQPIKKIIGQFYFVRICRIGVGYEKSIGDAVNLLEHLRSQGVFNARLVIIGAIENELIYQKYQTHSLASDGILSFITEPEQTKEASKMLYLADAVVGTGRGVMEAMALGKPALTIDSQGGIPVLINENTFNQAFETNFSERNNFPGINSIENLDNIIRLTRDKQYLEEISAFSRQMFKQHFSIEQAGERYKNAYINAVLGDGRIIEDLPMIIKSHLNIIRKTRLLQ